RAVLSARIPEGRAALVDMSRVAVARDLAPTVKVLTERYADYDQQAIRVVARYDAKPLDPAGVLTLSGIAPDAAPEACSERPIIGGPALCYSARRGAAPVLEGISMPLYLGGGTPSVYEEDLRRSVDDIRGSRVSEKESKLPPGVTLTPDGGLTGTPTDLSDAPDSIGYVDAYNNKIATLSILEGEPTVPPIAV